MVFCRISFLDVPKVSIAVILKGCGVHKNAERGRQIRRSVATVLESYGRMTSQSTGLAECEDTGFHRNVWKR
jgi:hypothetical protein